MNGIRSHAEILSCLKARPFCLAKTTATESDCFAEIFSQLYHPPSLLYVLLLIFFWLKGKDCARRFLRWKSLNHFRLGASYRKMTDFWYESYSLHSTSLESNLDVHVRKESSQSKVKSMVKLCCWYLHDEIEHWKFWTILQRILLKRGVSMKFTEQRGCRGDNSVCLL